MTWAVGTAGYYTQISTHTPLTGRDGKTGSFLIFNSISTHTPLTGRDINCGVWYGHSTISTHTPLTGRDKYAADSQTAVENFYSHAPYGT